MEESIFIGWSLSDKLALKVKENLKQSGYSAIVGGKSSSSVEHGVGDTIIKQMKSCVGAIMLFSPRPEIHKDENGNDVILTTISQNMLFELGYLTGSMRLKRVFAVYLDGAEQYAPSDLIGSWAIKIETKGKDNEALAKEIVDVFLHEQVDTIDENKLELLSNISILQSRISHHMESPVYYEWEIAQFVIIYGKASYIFQDMENAEALLKKLLEHTEYGALTCAIDAMLNYYVTCNSLQSNADDEPLHLPRKAFNKIRNSYLGIIEDVLEINTYESLKNMILMVCYEQLAFANMMYYSFYTDECDEEALEYRLNVSQKALEYANLFRKDNENKNDLFVCLIEAYTYRNKALLCKNNGLDEMAQESFELSTQCRKKLKRFVEQKDLSKVVQDHFNLEYYLSLSDNIMDVDSATRRRRVYELEEFLDECSLSSYDRIYLVDNIRKIVEKAK